MLLSEEVPDQDVRALYSEFNKFGATVVSAALARRQEVRPESLIPTSHFALLSPHTEVTSERIRRAKLHTVYVDTPIALCSDVKYEFSSAHRISDLIAPRDYIETVLRHSGTEIGGNVYHV